MLRVGGGGFGRRNGKGCARNVGWDICRFFLLGSDVSLISKNDSF